MENCLTVPTKDNTGLSLIQRFTPKERNMFVHKNTCKKVFREVFFFQRSFIHKLKLEITSSAQQMKN